MAEPWFSAGVCWHLSSLRGHTRPCLHFEGTDFLSGSGRGRPRGGECRVPGQQRTPRVHSNSFCPRRGDGDADDGTFYPCAGMQDLKGKPLFRDGNAGEGLPFQNRCFTMNTAQEHGPFHPPPTTSKGPRQ